MTPAETKLRSWKYAFSGEASASGSLAASLLKPDSKGS